MDRRLSSRQRYDLAQRLRKEHWERCATNKTYEQWVKEQTN